MKIVNKKAQFEIDRLALLMLFLFLLFSFLIIRLFKLQILDFDFYSILAADQHKIYRTLIPKRGEVFLRSMDKPNKLYPFILNKNYYFVYAVPKAIEDPVKVADQLIEILALDGEKNRDKLIASLSKENDPYEPIKDKVEEEVINKIKELNIAGIRYRSSEWRYYVQDNVGSQLSGFLGVRKYENVGLYGIEGHYNSLLSGEKGDLKTETDASGRWISLTQKHLKEAKDGADLVLTIDRTIEYEVCERLKNAVQRYEAESGSIIVSEPNTGAIIAMCNYPDFNPNIYNKVENSSVYNNNAIFYAYEPGSIFKGLTIASAIDQGKINPNTKYEDKGFVKVDRFIIRNADYKVYGQANMTEVLEKSINTGVIFAVKQIGNKKFRQYIHNFGFGSKTGIDLDTESAGNISSLDKNADIYDFTASFGQGITVTPLQMVMAYGALANGGLLMKPYVVEQINFADGLTQKTKPKVIRRVISARTSALIGGMLESVIKFGHAKLASVRGYSLGGKTGTAQVADTNTRGYSEDTIHSFIGYGPVEEPKFVIIVRLDKPKIGKYSASTAAPLFAEISEFILRYMKIPPNN